MRLTLPARPARFDSTRLLLPLAVLPGLAMVAAHVPLALLTMGPLVLASWLLGQRERFCLDHCVVDIDGPALRLRYRYRVLAALDLRYAVRHSCPPDGVVLSEGDACFLAFCADPAKEDADAPPIPDDGLAGVDPLHGLWRSVRLDPAHLAQLHAVLAAIAPQAPPDPDAPASLLPALGSVGRWGREAEAQLVRHLRGAPAGDARGGGLGAAVRELALRPVHDAAGQAARRVLLAAWH